MFKEIVRFEGSGGLAKHEDEYFESRAFLALVIPTCGFARRRLTPDFTVTETQVTPTKK